MTFKTKTTFILCFLMLAIGFQSCKKDKDPSGSEQVVPVYDGEYIGKWTLKGSGQIYSIELLGNARYIVQLNYGARKIKNQSPINSPVAFPINAKSASSLVKLGTYKVEGDKIILIGFGIIGDMKFTEKEFHFSFAVNENSAGKDMVATKNAPAISESDKTNLLCQTWKISKVTKAANLTQEKLDMIAMLFGSTDDKQIQSVYSGSTILFSRAGTYLTLYPTGDAVLSEWKWHNSEETVMQYSHMGWTEPVPTTAQIKNLTAGTVEIHDALLIFYLTK